MELPSYGVFSVSRVLKANITFRRGELLKMVTLSFFYEIYLFSRQFTRFSSHISKKLRFIFKSFSAIYFCQKGGSLPPESRGIKL